MTDAFRSEITAITGIEVIGSSEEDMLYQLLTESIGRLLNEPGEKLFQILYRLDVAELKVQAVLNNSTADHWPGELAKLILEREKERQKWRAIYKSDPDSKPSGENQPEHR